MANQKSFNLAVHQAIREIKNNVIMDLKPLKPPYPTSVYIEPTNMCVLECKYCMHEDMVREMGFMKYELFTKIIDDIKGKMHQVELLGQGEPLLHKDLPKMIKYAKDNGFTTSTISNGVLLKEEKMRNLIDAGLDILKISFDFKEKESWMKHKRGTSGAYDVTLNNILKAIDMAREAGHPEIRIDMIKYGDEDKEQKREYLKEWNKRLEGVGKSAIQDLINMWGKNDDDPSLTWYRDMKNYIEKNDIDEKQFPVCFFPWTNCVIYWDGRVSGCTVDCNARAVVGDVNKESFLDIWKGKEYQKYRTWCLDRVFDDSGQNGMICRKCNLILCPQDNMNLSLKYKMLMRLYDIRYKYSEKIDETKTIDDIFIYNFDRRKFVLKEEYKTRGKK